MDTLSPSSHSCSSVQWRAISVFSGDPYLVFNGDPYLVFNGDPYRCSVEIHIGVQWRSISVFNGDPYRCSVESHIGVQWRSISVFSGDPYLLLTGKPQTPNNCFCGFPVRVRNHISICSEGCPFCADWITCGDWHLTEHPLTSHKS